MTTVEPTGTDARDTSLQVAGNVAVLQAPNSWHTRPARLPVLMVAGVMPDLTSAHLVADAKVGGSTLHQFSKALTTAALSGISRVVSVSLLAASKQLLHTAHGVGLQVPTPRQTSEPPSQ
jgi:hypothetical protein